MNMTHVFKNSSFVADMQRHLQKSSVREFSNETNGLLSYSKVQRLAKGKGTLSAIDLVICCSVMKTSPYDYFERVLL